MPEMLLINPAKRRKTAKRRKNPSAAQRANWARFAKMARAKAKASDRRPNPKRRVRRSNPVAATVRRVVRRSKGRVMRRHNPISMGGSGLFNLRGYMQPLKDAAIMGAGAVAMDVAFGYVNRYLPASVQVVPGSVGVGDAVKAILTVALGKVLSKPTRGLSSKAAMGSLVVQMRDITMKVIPAGVMPVNGLGYVTAGRVVPQINARVNSNRRAVVGGGGAAGTVGLYTGGTPLLSRAGTVGQYTGGTPLLSRASAPARR